LQCGDAAKPDRSLNALKTVFNYDQH